MVANSFVDFQGAEDKVERDAVVALLKQQATAAPATSNATHHAVEHTITYPSRLIYYLNEDSESTYHDLNTQTRNQATEGQVSSLVQHAENQFLISTRCYLTGSLMRFSEDRIDFA